MPWHASSDTAAVTTCRHRKRLPLRAVVIVRRRTWQLPSHAFIGHDSCHDVTSSGKTRREVIKGSQIDGNPSVHPPCYMRGGVQERRETGTISRFRELAVSFRLVSFRSVSLVSFNARLRSGYAASRCASCSHRKKGNTPAHRGNVVLTDQILHHGSPSPQD